MRKLFTFLLALAASVGMSWATTNSITINESSHGSVVASSSSAAAGETITLTATPDDGYQLKSISGVYLPVPETLNYVIAQATVTGTEFQCVGTMNANAYGWRVYNPGTAQTLTVSSLNGTTLIKKIEFTATMGPSRTNDMLSVSAGTLSFDGNTPSTTVTINDINATSVTISGSGTNSAKTWYINSVRVYTEEVELEISDTENANVKTFTMVDGEVTISAEFEPASTPEPEPAEVTVVFAANNKTVEKTVTLPHTFKCDWAAGMDEPDELDRIIVELYNDYYYCNNNINASGSDQVEVGTEENPQNDYITIKGVFEGTATVTGGYLDGEYEAHNYTLTISVKGGSTPEPEPAEDVNITPNVDPDHAGVYYSTFYDSANKYALPAGVEAYVATLDGANLLLSKIAVAGQTIPANNAVILKSSVASFTLSISDAEAVPVNTINSLQGTDVSIATPDNCYVLAGNEGVGFYHYTASMLNPHKAYVIYSGTPNQAPRRMPFIFDQATGVENTNDQMRNCENAKIIRNGQLYIIKNGVRYNAQGQVVK